MKILFISLGCDKNLVDTEMMLGMLEDAHYSFTDDESEADIVVINSCCFIGDAKQESINTILEFSEMKKSGKLKALIVCGCLAQRYTKEIREELPEVDAIVGTLSIDHIVQAIKDSVEKKKTDYLESIDRAPITDQKRIVTTGGHFAYMKIAEGCDKHCTYCVIPKVRGDFRSVPMENLVEEAKRLADSGVKELILVAQETTMYGTDLYGEKKLPELLHRLCEISGLFWIRLLYCYPEEITDELIDTIASEEKICHYLDIPIQHAADSVLKRMGRRTNKAQLEEMVHKLRERIPDICLRTTLISGFPGETRKDFIELYNFVDEMEFDRLGVFPYSKEEDTAAALLPNQVTEKTKCARRDEIMELQQEISAEKAEAMIGKVLTVMVEGKVADEDTYVTRTYRDAPNVDGYLFLNTTATLVTGDLVRVLVTDANEYDLMGEIYHE